MPNPIILNFAADVLAANTETRQISGVVVPWGKTGNTSAGAVTFEFGSIPNPDPAGVKFLLQHQADRPIGKAIDFAVTPGGITGTFKVSATTAGNDALVEAADGLRSGLSVGAKVNSYEMRDGVMHVTSADIIEVSLVHEPAFKDAQVTDVAATETETVDAEPTQQESTPIEETAMSETENTEATTADVEAAAAAHVQVAAATAPAYTAPRSPITTGGSYLEHTIKAANGNRESAMYVAAADDSTTTNTGFTLPQHLQDYITSTFTNSPAIDAITSRPLIASGMSFTIPRQTTAPTVAITAEGAAPSETGVTSDYLTVDVKKFSGLQRMTFEIVDRSDPNYFAEVLQELQKAYTKACDNAVIAAFTANGTQAATVATTAAGLQSFVATETAAAYKGSAEFAENLVVSPDQWAAIMGYADTTGRPLYIAGQPANAAGAAAPTSARGSVLGLNLFVDQNIATSGLVDESAFIVAPGAATWYSSGTTQLQVNRLTDGKVEVELYGYGAIAIRKPLGIRRYNVV